MSAGHDYDVIVVGSGVAGLSVALGLAGVRRVALVTGGSLGGGSTSWAQGGLAGAIGVDDTPALHAQDTLVSGGWLGDEAAVGIITDGAPEGLAALLRAGAQLDRDDGHRLALGREGGHHRSRIVHAGGDASGAEVSRALTAAVRASGITIIEQTTVTGLLTAASHSGPAVAGITVRRTDQARVEDGELTARAVVLATGGIGGLYAATTNPPEVTGAGLGLALAAGAALTDLEFVQFHPTAFGAGAATGQVPLITEALRGEGATLRDEAGEPVMAGRHPLGDLAPRDIVARRIDEVITSGGRVLLDASALGGIVRDRFPTVAAICQQHGIDPAADPIPVAPAQHFACGGVLTDTWGATSVAGLYAVGEVAATGLHGANRLASNSLIEGLVVGRRTAARLCLDLPSATAPRPLEVTGAGPSIAGSEPAIRAVMSTYAGIRRTGAGLATALVALGDLPTAGGPRDDVAGYQQLAAAAIVTAAAARQESRGCHWRSDHPAASGQWRRRVVVRLDRDGMPAAETTAPLARTA